LEIIKKELMPYTHDAEAFRARLTELVKMGKDWLRKEAAKVPRAPAKRGGKKASKA
jgi:hypothetical protein